MGSSLSNPAGRYGAIGNVANSGANGLATAPRAVHNAGSKLFPNVPPAMTSLTPIRWVTFFLLLACAVHAQAARIIAVQGQVAIQRGDNTLPAKLGTRLQEGDEFVSDSDGEALVRFDDGARLALRAYSRLAVKNLQLKGPVTARQKTIRVVKGALRYISSKGSRRSQVSFETNTTTVGIRGTDIEIVVADEPIGTDPVGTYLKVNTGSAVMVGIDGTQVAVDPGQEAFGGEPELVPRGSNARPRPAARRVDGGTTGVFKSGSLDKLMK